MFAKTTPTGKESDPMHSIYTKSLFKSLNEYLDIYKSLFYKRSFQKFLIIICSILAVQEIRSIRFIYEKFIKKYFEGCLNSFYYFLADDSLDLSKMAIMTLSKALTLIAPHIRDKVTIYLIVDDTLQPKFGKCFECCSTLFDHADHSGRPYKNGHCFVSLALALPLLIHNRIRYINIPIGCKLYDKSKTKLELAAELIEEVAPVLEKYQVIVLCDAWYTKKPFLSRILAFDFIHFIGAARVDTVTYELPPPPTGKKGRPRKKGDRIDYKKLDYSTKGISENLFQVTVSCLTNLTERVVYATYTTNDRTSFSSVRLYISSIPPESIRSFAVDTPDGLDLEGKPKLSNVFSIYRMRWSIEVMFYQQKTFWSFGKYMVRSKMAIEKYAHLVGVTYTLTILLPFINSNFSKYQFQSPQEIKYILGAKLHEELIIDKLLKTLQLKKNTTAFNALREHLNSEDIAS